MKKTFLEKIVSISTILVIMLAALQLFLSGVISADSIEIGSIEERIAILEKENRLLEEKIARSSSLPVIQDKAIRLGFDEPCFLVDFSSEEPFALKR